jgi:DNA-binding CsgD family transcriptional regulator
MKQVEITKFPSGGGWAVVQLRQTPDEVAERLGITFEDDCDDLGEFRRAALWSESIGQIYLEGRPHPDMKGVIVEVDAARNRSEAIGALTAETGFDARDFEWITEWDSMPHFNEEAQMRPWPDRTATSDPSLTDRELDVVTQVAINKPVRAIAKDLHIAPSTVSGHLQRIYLKLGVHSRAELKEALKRYPHLARSA